MRLKKGESMKARIFQNVSLLLALSIITGCGSSNGINANNRSKSQSSPNITPTEFVAALAGAMSSDLILDTHETLRTQKHGGAGWFVIYDRMAFDYKAVNLRFLREQIYYDHMASNYGIASQFRADVNNNEKNRNSNGVPHLDAYEVVDYNKATGYYEGRLSKHLYEDEGETTDVSLLAKEKELKRFFQKAANVSIKYNLGIETSMSLVTLGAKVEKMLSRSNNELTVEDQSVLMNDLKILTGLSLQEIQELSSDSKAKAEMLDSIAKKIGTNSTNLEQKLLPEVFGIVL